MVVSVICSKWFKDQELSLAIGICASSPNLISFISGWFVPLFDDLQPALDFGFQTTVISLLCGILLIVVDKSREKHDEQVMKNFTMLHKPPTKRFTSINSPSTSRVTEGEN